MRSHQEGTGKKTTADTLQDAKIKSSKCKLVKSIKPLVNYKFYLDIERHNILLKIESKIRELGGSIEFFLTKDITHFITDKKDQNNYSSQQQAHQQQQSPATPNYLSPTIARTPSSNDLKTNSRIRTRADAMLHRARKGTCETIENKIKTVGGASVTTPTINPSQIVESWGTPVWHTEYALKFLEKVYSYIKERYIDTTNHTKSSTSLRHKSKHAQIFKGNYIKIESSQKGGNYRPYYKIFNSKWPAINLKPHKNGIFPLTAVDENYFYNSETKTIGTNRKPNGTTSVALKSIKSVKKTVTRKSSINDIKMTRKNRTSSKHIRAKATVGKAAGTGVTGATNTTTTTTTNSNNKQNISSEKQCGFCEICRVEYDALTVHLKSESHQNFVKNENNFLALDSLIKSSANVDKFLSLNNKMTSIHLENNANNQCDIITYSPSKRTSKRISNNGNQLKTQLPPPAAPPPPPLSPHSSPQTATAIIRNKSSSSSSPHKSHPHNDHQIEILEKTTTLGHTRQTRQQQQTFINCLPLQLPNNDVKCENDGDDMNSINAVRARRQSAKKINYAEPKEDEEENAIENNSIVDYNRHQRKKKPKIKDKEKSIKHLRGGGSSQTDIKQLSLPTSLLYKVVETNVKKRRTSPKKNNISISSQKVREQQQSKKEIKEEDEENKRREQQSQQQQQQSPQNKQPSPIIVKIRKVRQSELSILSGEAANFMFPKRQISSEPTDVDRQTTSDGRGMFNNSSSTTISSSSSINRFDEWKLTERKATLKRKRSNLGTATATDVELSGATRKKRRLNLNNRENEDVMERTALATITTTINTSNVKESESCLDLRSSPRLSLEKNPPLRTYGRRKANNKKKNGQQTRRNNAKTLKSEKEEDIGEHEVPKIPLLDDIVNEKLIKYKFAFERIPGNELWYQVFRRQDEGYERSFEYFGSTAYRKLPYEMGPLRPSTKPLCALCHINSKTSEHKSATTTSTSTTKTTIAATVATAASSNKSPEKVSKSPKKDSSTENDSKIRKKEKKTISRAAALLNLEMPRKSPREHASTLAILSCLLQRKNVQQQQPTNLTAPSSSSFLQCAIKADDLKSSSGIKMKTEQNKDGNGDRNNQICTQISENVKRLRRGEKVSIAGAATTTAVVNSSATTAAAAVASARTTNLLGLKKSEKQKKNIRKLPSSSLMSSSSGRRNLKFEIDNSNLKKSTEQEHINVLKLKREIDAYLTSSPSDNDDLLLDSPSQISLPIDTDDIEDFTQFSQDFDLYELLQQQDGNGCGGAGRSISNKNGYGLGSGGGGSSYNNSFRGNNRFRLFKIYPTNKKRKNKTGWPTTKKRTATRHHTKQLQLQHQHQQQQQQQQKQQQQLLSSKKSLDDNQSILKLEASTATKATTTATTTITTTTTTAATTNTATTNAFKYPKSENDVNDITTHSPITPPESDNEEDEDGGGGGGDGEGDGDDDGDQRTNHNDDEDNNCADKNDCDETVSNSTTDCKNSTINHHHHNHHRLQHPPLMHHVHHNHHHHHHHHHNHLHNNQQNFSATDASDIFTVSSDSLDTVLDVGSQIKSEDQEEIIASSKCNGAKLNNNQNHQSIATPPICCDDDDDINDDAIAALTQKTSSSSSSLSSPLKKLCVMSPNSSGCSSNSINNRKMRFPNSIRIDNTTTKLINSRKLSNNSAKDLKVVVVVRRERNNSVCSSSASGGGGGDSKPQQSNEVKSSRESDDDTKTTPIKEVVVNNNNGNDSIVVVHPPPPTVTTTTTISPRRLRKPRGRWYRER